MFKRRQKKTERKNPPTYPTLVTELKERQRHLIWQFNDYLSLFYYSIFMSIFKLLTLSGMVKLKQVSSKLNKLPALPSHHFVISIKTTHIFKFYSTHIFRDCKVGASLFYCGATVFQLIVTFLVLRHSPEEG